MWPPKNKYVQRNNNKADDYSTENVKARNIRITF